MREIGWYELKTTPAGRIDPLIAGLPKSFRSFKWHYDYYQLPSDAIKLVTSRDYPTQAFRLRRAYGLLFHLEVTLEMVID